jgi:hypothetical protein
MKVIQHKGLQIEGKYKEIGHVEGHNIIISLNYKTSKVKLLNTFTICESRYTIKRK